MAIYEKIPPCPRSLPQEYRPLSFGWKFEKGKNKKVEMKRKRWKYKRKRWKYKRKR
jgi:hypothetical protein